MCIIATYIFPCGHELRHPISHCPNFDPSDPRSNQDNCGYVSFEPLRVGSKCTQADCRYWGDLNRCWRCCQCRQGPNKGAKCLAEVERILGAPTRECVHRWCENCEPWDRSPGSKKKVGLIEKLFGKTKKKSGDQKEGHKGKKAGDENVLVVQRAYTPRPPLASGEE